MHFMHKLQIISSSSSHMQPEWDRLAGVMGLGLRVSADCFYYLKSKFNKQVIYLF